MFVSEADGANRRNQVSGYLQMFVSTSCFSGVAAVSKAIGPKLSTQEKMLWRSIISILCSLTMGIRIRTPAKGTSRSFFLPKRPWLLLLRAVCGHVALSAYMESIERLPLAIAMLIGKIHPFVAALLSWTFLGEKLLPSRAAAILISIAGVALVSRRVPGEAAKDVSTFGVFFAVVAGVLSGAAYCCVRALARSGESDLWMLLGFPLLTLVCSSVSGLKAGIQITSLDSGQWALALALGLLAHGGQIFLARGLRLLPAASGTQTTYLGAIQGVLLGAVLGDDWPPWNFWVGGSIIIIALRFADKTELADQIAKPKLS